MVFDSNEATADRTQTLMWNLSQRDIECDSEQLVSGDVYWWAKGQDGRFSRTVGCEIKLAPEDVLNSLGDGRLTNQLPRLVEDYTIPYLLMLKKGRFAINFDSGSLQRRYSGGYEDTRFQYHYLNSILMKFEMAGGCVRWFNSLKEMELWLVSAYRYYREDSHNERTWQRRKPLRNEWRLLQSPMIDFYERIVSIGGRSIGLDRAIHLAENYPVPAMLVGVDEGQLAVQEIAGGRKFGARYAERVAQWFNKGKVI